MLSVIEASIAVTCGMYLHPTDRDRQLIPIFSSSESTHVGICCIWQLAFMVHEGQNPWRRPLATKVLAFATSGGA